MNTYLPQCRPLFTNAIDSMYSKMVLKPLQWDQHGARMAIRAAGIGLHWHSGTFGRIEASVIKLEPEPAVVGF